MNDWYVMTHRDMSRFSEWLKMENAQRLREGKLIIEPFYPNDYLKAQSNDLSHFVFLKADEVDIDALVNHPQNLTSMVRLRHYKDTDGSKATVPDSMMQMFLQACLEHGEQLELAPPVGSIERTDRVKIKSGPFAGCEATVQQVQHTHGAIHLDLAIELVTGVMSISMNHVDKRHITILDRGMADDIRTDFIEYTQNHLLEILRHRVKRVDDETVCRRDADMLVRLYRYRHHHIKNGSARCHFLALMLICAHLIRYQKEENLLRDQALQALKDLNGKSESKAATDTRTYLWIALYISTHDPVYRNAAKQNVLSCSISAEPNFFPEHGEYFSAYSVNEGDTVVSVVESEFNYFEKNWYKKPMLEGKPCWITPFSDFNSGTINHHAAVGSYCIPLRVKGGRVVGVLSADFSFQKLREAILATHHPYPNSYFMLLGPAGGYLVHPNTELLFKKSIFNANDSTEHPDIIALGKKMTAGEHGAMHVVLDKEECHVCYAPVPHTGWSIALVCLEDDVLADYRHLEIILAALVIFGLIIIWWITRKVVQQNLIPINNLLEATKKIADGNYDVEIPLSDRKDTVSQLQNAFREMHLSILEEKENIKRTTEEISKEKEELERAMPISKEAARRRNHFIHNVNHRITSPLNTIESLANFRFAYLTSALYLNGDISNDGHLFWCTNTWWGVYDNQAFTLSNYEYLGYTIDLNHHRSITPMTGVIHSWKYDQDADIAAGTYNSFSHWNLYLWANYL